MRRGGGGVAFLVHHSVRFADIDVSPLIPPGNLTLELQGITAHINNSEIKIYNIYIPPAYNPYIGKIIDNSAWYLSLSDSRDDALAQQIEDSDFHILNTDTPMRLPPNGSLTSPDIFAHLCPLGSVSIMVY